MATKRVWAWSGRLTALLAAVIIPACGSTGSPGGANPNGILWNSQGTPGGGGALGPAQQLWIDPQLGVPATIGINNIVTSTDDATYDSYGASGGVGNVGQVIRYATGNLHPLSTDTGSRAITSRENELQGSINGYRQQQLGNVGAGGGGNVGGGVAVGNTTGIILAGHFRATKSARAHCKYFALGYGGAIAFAPGPNTEGDDMQGTNLNSVWQNGFRVPTPGGSLGNAYGLGSVETDPAGYKNPYGDQGRLGKLKTVAFVPSFATADFCISGLTYTEAGAVMSFLLRTAPGAIAAMGPTHFGVGHWRGGTAFYYWDIIYLLNPTDY